MKKILFAAVAASGLCFTACNNEVDSMMEQQNESNVIGFSAYAMMSKGTPITGNGADGVYDNEGLFQYTLRMFHVAAYISALPTQYLNAPIQFTSGKKWDYLNPLDKVYWPTKNELLNFYAVQPYNDFFFDAQKKGDVTYDNPKKKLTMTYTVPTVLNAQQDLMYAVAFNVAKPALGSSVSLPFKHALNQVLFNARTDSKELFVEIYKNGIEVCNIKNSGTLDVSENQAAWTAGITQSDYAIETFHASENSTSITINTQPTSGGIGTIKALSNPMNTPMLIPQVVTPWVPNPTIANNNATDPQQTGAYLKIKCKIWMNNGGNPVYLHGSAVNGEADGFDYIYVPFPGNKMNNIGKRITYTLVFGGGYTDPGEPILTPITFETTVSEWNWESQTPDITL